jgi:N-hydroxyarylamine O-acetyltransferase
MALDLDAYLERIGYGGRVEPTVGCLHELHLAHVTSIPFENLDILLGRPIRLDLESVQRKLVRDRRGGYCFEQNALFATALERIGFAVTRLAARVHGGSGGRTHMVLRVDVEGASWLADVGFGGGSVLHPVRLDPGTVVDQYGWRFRLVDHGGATTLQARRPEGWVEFYAFTLEPQLPVDYEIANHYTSTHPDSPFTRTLTVQRTSPDRSWILRDRTLFELTPSAETETTITDEELLAVLAGRFEISLPEGTRLVSLEGNDR